MGIWYATFARTSHAHDPFEITAVARLGAETPSVEVTMARSTALRLATGRGGARESFAPGEFAAHRARFEASAPSLYELTSGGQPLGLRSASAKLTRENDVEVVLAFERPRDARVVLRAKHLLVLPEGYTSALSVAAGGREPTRFKVLTAVDPTLEARFASPEEPASSPSNETPFARVFGFLALGAKHVLTGYDHLLFLFGVLVACRTLRAMLAVTTSFTVAHSLTLALAVLGHVSIASTIVEPLIALSIVFVGVENALRRDAIRFRIAVTFAFGLVHGLGFAGALEALALGASELPLALVGFNLGVELGQLSLAALALPALSKLQATERGTRSLRFSSVALCVVGLAWFVERVAGAS